MHHKCNLYLFECVSTTIAGTPKPSSSHYSNIKWNDRELKDIAVPEF